MPDARTYSIITETALKQEEYEYALKILELYEKVIERTRAGHCLAMDSMRHCARLILP
jgi:hypothetical protein